MQGKRKRQNEGAPRKLAREREKERKGERGEETDRQ